MQHNIELIEIIEDYLLGNLSSDKKNDFEAQLKNDTELRLRVAQQAQLLQAFETLRIQHESLRIAKASKIIVADKDSFIPWAKIITTIVVLLAVMSAIWLLTKRSPETVLPMASVPDVPNTTSVDPKSPALPSKDDNTTLTHSSKEKIPPTKILKKPGETILTDSVGIAVAYQVNSVDAFVLLGNNTEPASMLEEGRKKLLLSLESGNPNSVDLKNYEEALSLFSQAILKLQETTPDDSEKNLLDRAKFFKGSALSIKNREEAKLLLIEVRNSAAERSIRDLADKAIKKMK